MSALGTRLQCVDEQWSNVMIFDKSRQVLVVVVVVVVVLVFAYENKG